MPDEKELAIIDVPAHEVAAHDPFASALDAKRFRANLTRRQENRDTLMAWLRDALVDGIDFGRIHVVKKETCDRGKYCTDPYHFSKPSLWKPGAEKICGMLGVTASFPSLADIESLFNSGHAIETIMVRCVLTNDAGQVVATGIGARSLAQDAMDANKAIKMATKSAMVDATLRAGGLSEVFTQDMEGDTDGPVVDPYTPNAAPGDNPMARTSNIDVTTHCTIGKWKGTLWSDVDDGMLTWIDETITDKPDVLAAAQKEMDRRKAEAGVPKSAPHDGGSSELAGYARSIISETDVETLRETWRQVPKRLQPALRKSFITQAKKLEGAS